MVLLERKDNVDQMESRFVCVCVSRGAESNGDDCSKGD